jgi:hypothetical protein
MAVNYNPTRLNIQNKVSGFRNLGVSIFISVFLKFITSNRNASSIGNPVRRAIPFSGYPVLKGTTIAR